MDVVYEPHKVIPLAEFHSELLFEFPDLPSNLLDYYMIKASRKMASDGSLVRRKAIIETQHCVTRYRLEPPDDMELCSILGGYVHQCGSCGPHKINRSFDPPTTATRCCDGVLWYDEQEKVLHIKQPYYPGQYYITMAVQPSLSSCVLPEEYLTNYLDTLLSGTKAYILLVTGRPWTNLQLGQAYMKDFAVRIADEAIKLNTHRQRGSIRMQFGRAL